MFSECAYEVMYRDGAGHRHRSSKGLKVSRSSALGTVRSKEEFQTARLAALDRARSLWNELDQSEDARYHVDME